MGGLEEWEGRRAGLVQTPGRPNIVMYAGMGVCLCVGMYVVWVFMWPWVFIWMWPGELLGHLQDEPHRQGNVLHLQCPGCRADLQVLIKGVLNKKKVIIFHDKEFKKISIKTTFKSEIKFIILSPDPNKCQHLVTPPRFSQGAS